MNETFIKELATVALIRCLTEENFKPDSWKEKFDSQSDFLKFLKELKKLIAKIMMENQTTSMSGKCFSCKNKQTIPGDCHVSCACRSAIAFGEDVGISKGYFLWPFNFDLIWLKYCDSYEEKE